jgi:hypothetical protein
LRRKATCTTASPSPRASGGAPLADDLLLLDDVVDALDLVAQLGRQLEVHLLGGGGHALLQLGDDLLALALQEERHLLDVARVGGRVGHADAGGQAAVHVVVEAGPVGVAGDGDLALAQGEEPVDQPQHVLDGTGGGVGAEVAPAVLDDAADDQHPRPGLVGDLDVGVGLVVLQPDVEVRLVALDQLVLEDQRLGGRVGADHLEVGDLGHQGDRLGRQGAGRAEVGAHAVAQRGGLADVDDLAGRALHQVDARVGAERAEALAEARIHA